MSETQTCGRRMTDFGPWPREENLDKWEKRGGNDHRSCSFCGSMHPEDFLKAVKDHEEIGPTDKSYKFYVDNHRGKFYTQHLSPEQGDQLRELIDGRKVNWGFPGRPYVGLYVPTTKTEDNG